MFSKMNKNTMYILIAVLAVVLIALLAFVGLYGANHGWFGSEEKAEAQVTVGTTDMTEDTLTEDPTDSAQQTTAPTGTSSISKDFCASSRAVCICLMLINL